MNRKMPKQTVMCSNNQYWSLKKRTMQQQDWMSKPLCRVKKVSHTRVYTVWFLLCEILTETNLIYGGKTKQNKTVVFSGECFRQLTLKGQAELPGLVVIFTILTGVVSYIGVRICQNLVNIQLRSVLFIACKFYLKRKECNILNCINDMHTKIFRGKVYWWLQFTLKCIKNKIGTDRWINIDIANILKY